MQDILYNIFLHLPPPDIITCMSVNKFFNKCALQPWVWKPLVQQFNTTLFFGDYFITYEQCYKFDQIEILYGD